MTSLRQYQVILLGPKASLERDRVFNTLRERISDLGDGIWEHIHVIEGDKIQFEDTAPTFVVWFGALSTASAGHLQALDALLQGAKLVLPVYSPKEDFKAQVPAELHSINHIEWVDKGTDSEESIKIMRARMISEPNYVGAVFVGGMEGIEAEFNEFLVTRKGTTVLPIASTGGAALILFDKWANAEGRNCVCVFI